MKEIEERLPLTLLAKRMNVSRRQVLRWCDAGLTYSKPGGVRMFSATDVERFFSRYTPAKVNEPK
jgi:hypothetical protein